VGHIRSEFATGNREGMSRDFGINRAETLDQWEGVLTPEGTKVPQGLKPLRAHSWRRHAWRRAL